MGKTSVRVKCPLCGWQVAQSRFQRENWTPGNTLEMATFTSEGRGKFLWQKNVEVKGRLLLLVGLKNKLERLLAAVNRELNPEMISGSEMMEHSVGVTSALLSTQTSMEISTLRSTKTGAVMSTASLMR